jgi:hypothetical protein
VPGLFGVGRRRASAGGPRRGRRPAVALVAATALVACSESDSGGQVLSGTVDVIDAGSTDSAPLTECRGVDPYADVVEGTTVTATTAEGGDVTAGTLGAPTFRPDADTPLLGLCEFPLVAGEPLPKADTYQLRVGEHEPVTFSHDQLEADGWVVTITLR